MSTEIMNPADVNESPAILSGLPTTSLEDFQAKSFMEPVSPLAAAIQRESKTDTVLHIGKQISSEDVAGHVLTIIRVGYGTAPSVDMQGNPIWETDENGQPAVDENGQAIQRMARFAVCHFKEAPGYWYNGGKMLQGILETLVTECGDNPDDLMLPNVNAALEECGGLRAYFDWKQSRKNKGQRYMNIIVA